jgi:hypothetical protein
MNQIYTKSPQPGSNARKKAKGGGSKGYLSNYDVAKDNSGLTKSSRLPKNILNSAQRDESPDLSFKK